MNFIFNRKLHIICVLCFSIYTSYAQKKDSTAYKPYSHEVGLNVTTALASFLNVNNTAFQNNPYVLTYKYVESKGHALRLGIGADVRYKNSALGSNSVQRENQSSDYDVRLGYEYRIPASKHWMYYWGFDGVFSYSNEQVNTLVGIENVRTNTTEVAFGGGLVLGLQYHINARMSLGTEAIGYYLRSKRVIEDTFDFSPEFNSSETINGYDLQLVPPSALYFIFKF